MDKVRVNDAGRGITRSVAELTDEDLDLMMRDNVKIEHPRPEAYTQPGWKAEVERYYHDVAAFEAEASARSRR